MIPARIFLSKNNISPISCYFIFISEEIKQDFNRRHKTF